MVECVTCLDKSEHVAAFGYVKWSIKYATQPQQGVAIATYEGANEKRG